MNNLVLPYSLPMLTHRDGLPGLGLPGKGLKRLCRLAALGQDAYGRQKREFALLLKMYVFYFVHCHSGRTPGRYSGPVRNQKHTFLCTQRYARWRELYQRPFAGWSSGSETRAPPPSAWLIRKTSEVLDPRRSWAGVLGASGSCSILLSVSALYLADPLEVGAPGWLVLVWLSAESPQI